MIKKKCKAPSVSFIGSLFLIMFGFIGLSILLGMDVAMKKDQFDISSLFRPCTIQLLDYDLSLFGSSTFSMSLRIRLHKTKKKKLYGHMSLVF